MRSRWQSTLRALRDLRRFNALAPRQRSIVFYAEDAATGAHLEPVLRDLTGRRGCDVCYLASSPADPLLSGAVAGARSFYVGEGAIRTYLFTSLDADVMVMTMPDLETFHIKRSKARPVRYVYVFHSMVSTHMIYRSAAFDHFDHVLCVGPHHIEEIRARERLYTLPPKQLVPHGYGRLDAILARASARAPETTGRNGDALRVLVAPSWGPRGLIESRGVALVEVLLQAGFHVTVRPHPVTVKKWPQAVEDIRARIEGASAVLETDIASQESLHRSDLMISDWSGAALEYAFGLERPVLFVDVARKVNNPEYERLGIEPIEVSIRNEIGEVVSPDELERVPEAVRRLTADPSAFRARLRAARDRTVFNVGRSAEAGADFIAALADSRQKAGPTER